MSTNAYETAKLKEVMEREKMNWRSIADDGTVADKWNQPGTPLYYVLDPRLRRELLHRERGQRIHPYGAVARLRERGKFLDPLAQLRGERHEARLAERYVAPARRARPLDDRSHLQHLPLVEREPARHFQPVATRSEG